MATATNVTIIPAKPQTASNRNQYKQLRVAAYCRVSTEQEEQQNSYQVQIEYYTDLIHSKKEWTLAGIFADEGISGTQTKKRTEFNRMIRMCKQKKIDLILTKSISRFARNTVDCLEYVRILKELGIGVIFEKENINTLTMTSEFMIALYGSFAQAESESISKNVSLGVQMAMREGKVRYSYKRWLGYCKGEDGKPVIIPEEAEMIRKVYELFLDGHSMAAVAEMMLIHPTDKIEWHRETIRRILTNEKYTGDCLLQKTFTADCITHKAVKNNGERAMYLVSDCHPATTTGTSTSETTSEEGTTSSTTSETVPSVQENVLSPEICEELKEQAQELQESYPDAIGWIYIPDTSINYPIMQGEDNDFYLTHGTDGRSLKCGYIELDFRCENRFQNNFNILYGHNMKNGSMFANVCRFKDKSYYDSHPYGWVYTADSVYRLDFFSVAVTDWHDEIYNGFRSLDEWTPHLKEISRFYEEVELTEQDRLVLLSTCSYEFDNARTVLTGRLVEMESDMNA